MHELTRKNTHAHPSDKEVVKAIQKTEMLYYMLTSNVYKYILNALSLNESKKGKLMQIIGTKIRVSLFSTFFSQLSGCLVTGCTVHAIFRF